MAFLQRIAASFYRQYGNEVSQLTFVFPNRRAGLFFRRYLAMISEKPLFSPEILTINECFASATSFQQPDRLSNLFRLYRIFKQHSESDETFDSFVFWGEMLLSDFEEVDKYLVDPQQLFRNVTELKEIDLLFNTLSKNQINAIKQFWTNFEPVREGNTKEEFIATWKILYPVYEQLRNELRAENLATEGMICRDVAEQLRKNELPEEWTNKKFIFIGFNALNPCERQLMAGLQKQGMADFYWDYEAPELKDPDNPASLFYAENIHIFPSELTIDEEEENFDERCIELIAVPSAIGQTKQVYQLLNEIYPQDLSQHEWIKTAVILPDESLLLPLLHSLPEQISKINVTMGFPVSATPVSSLIEHIFELWKRARTSPQGTGFYHRNVSDILNHQYILSVCDKEIRPILKKMADFNLIYIPEQELCKHQLLQTIFTSGIDVNNFLPYLLKVLEALQKFRQTDDFQADIQLENDYIYQYYIAIKRMQDIMLHQTPVDGLNIDTLMKLIRQLTAGVTIPFIGEPLDGLQIMGVLESRGLEFDHLIMTSFNEGIFPRKTIANSFIPYNLRRGFGLPTYEHQDAITAYNFYRLIHRAKHVSFIYDSRTEGLQTGEVSRFMHQLRYHYGIKVQERNVTFDIAISQPNEIKVEKNAAVVEKLNRFLNDGENSRALSASAIKNYIDCPLQFYLTRVEDMEQTDEVTETVEDSMFGNLFHATMEYIYKPYQQKLVRSEDIEAWIKNPLYIDQKINQAFAVKFFRRKETDIVELEGNNLLIARVIRKYVMQVLRTDQKHAPFTYIDSEFKCSVKYPLGDKLINIKGFIDRIDEKEGEIRILDYKTGSGKLEFKSVSEVFEHNNDKRPKYVLQTFLYGILYESFAAGKIIVPGIYYMRDVFKDSFVTELQYKPDQKTKLPVENFADYEQEFRTELTHCLEEIFDVNVPFVQTTSNEPCKYCAYASICNR